MSRAFFAFYWPCWCRPILAGLVALALFKFPSSPLASQNWPAVESTVPLQFCPAGFSFSGRFVGGSLFRVLLYLGLSNFCGSRYITGTLHIAIDVPF